TFYLNGSAIGTDSSGTYTSVFNNSGPFIIGTNLNASTQSWFDGVVDEVGVWNTVLTSAEEDALYNGGTGLMLFSRATSTPANPTNLLLSSSSTDITLHWSDNSSNELGFKIERGTGGAFTQIATTSADATTYTDASLASGTYSYRLRAY